ncbi:MAG TPA: cytochrome P450 [Acidimicrobiales bacterium]|jgi:cytochrome P450|nr:cytochrome P450 [Acidimicrobiales bacterium]
MAFDYLIDPTDASFFTRPDYHEVLATLRAEAPVYECAPGLWTVARYEQIRDLSRDPEHFCSGRGALVNDPLRGADNPMATPSILHMDPPQHSDFRGLLNRRFTPRALTGLTDSVRRHAVAVIEAADPHEPIDFVAELSSPFPLLVIAELLGIDESSRGDFRRWSDAAIESPDLPPEETMSSLGELAGFIYEHLKRKRADPGEDLVSVLVQSEVNGCPLQKEELFMFLLTLLVAGNETTRTLLSGTALVLHEHPDQRAALVADPSLLPGAVEESLRWVTPVQAFCRTATEAATVAGMPIAEGDYLCMLYASGNRDEAVFGDDAGTFNIRRPANPMHVAFGFGEHVCLGASLARMEGRIFVEELLARYPDFAVTGQAERVASTTVAGIRSLPVVLSP